MKNIINISLPKYISAWLKNDSGGYPVCFAKNSVEFLIMEQFSVADKALSVESVQNMEDELVPVIVPKFKYKDDSFRYLTEKGRKALENCIKDRFNISLWRSLHKFGYIGRTRAYLIFAWMEANGIPDEDSNWEAIEKRYQRLRKQYLDSSRKKKQRFSKI